MDGQQLTEVANFTFIQWVLEEKMTKNLLIPSSKKLFLKLWVFVSNYIEMLNHDHIDILKIDVEGSEWNVLETLLTAKHVDVFEKIPQILIEVHFWNYDNVMPVLNGLLDLEYEIFTIHQNPWNDYCFEIGFKKGF